MIQMDRETDNLKNFSGQLIQKLSTPEPQPAPKVAQEETTEQNIEE